VTARVAGLALLLVATAAGAEQRFASFQDVAGKVVALFTAETGGVRNVKIDIRRRDTAPDADVTIVGVLGIDIKPKDGPAWYSVRLLFGEHDGRWSYLTAYHELPAEGPVWSEARDLYRGLAERAIAPFDR